MFINLAWDETGKIQWKEKGKRSRRICAYVHAQAHSRGLIHGSCVSMKKHLGVAAQTVSLDMCKMQIWSCHFTNYNLSVAYHYP